MGAITRAIQVRNELLIKSMLSYRHDGEKRGKMVTAYVYVKWNKNELFDRYRLNWRKERLDKLYNILCLYQKENIIENFYMYEIED